MHGKDIENPSRFTFGPTIKMGAIVKSKI